MRHPWQPSDAHAYDLHDEPGPTAAVGAPTPGKVTLTARLPARREAAVAPARRARAAPAIDPAYLHAALGFVPASGALPVQARGSLAGDGAAVQRAAAAGIAGAGGRLPHADRIAAAFGRHDIAGITAHVGGAARDACDELGAHAYATGEDVAFAAAPDLHTAAHEAAHVIQQRAGVQLRGGIGATGDRYERHADEVADAVVAGRSAEPLLDRFAGTGGVAVQRRARRERRTELTGRIVNVVATTDGVTDDPWCRITVNRGRQRGVEAGWSGKIHDATSGAAIATFGVIRVSDAECEGLVQLGVEEVLASRLVTLVDCDVAELHADARRQGRRRRPRAPLDAAVLSMSDQQNGWTSLTLNKGGADGVEDGWSAALLDEHGRPFAEIRLISVAEGKATGMVRAPLALVQQHRRARLAPGGIALASDGRTRRDPIEGRLVDARRVEDDYALREYGRPSTQGLSEVILEPGAAAGIAVGWSATLRDSLGAIELSVHRVSDRECRAIAPLPISALRFGVPVIFRPEPARRPSRGASEPVEKVVSSASVMMGATYFAGPVGDTPLSRQWRARVALKDRSKEWDAEVVHIVGEYVVAVRTTSIGEDLDPTAFYVVLQPPAG